MTHPADLYCETRERVIDLARNLDPDQTVPACPGWTVHSVIAHLVGLATDVANGRVDGYAGAAWTARQIDERSKHSMSDLIDEWRGFSANGLPTLRISPTDSDRTWDVGTGQPVAWLSASTIELLRSSGGRRTDSQIRACDWSGDTEGMIEQVVLPFFSAPQHPLRGE